MVQMRSRRALLRVTGGTTASVLTGCTLRYDPRDGGDSDGPGGGGSGSQTPVPHGTPYTFEVTNFISAEDLANAPAVPDDIPASVTIEVEAEHEDTTETLFEKSIDVPPGGVESLVDAFATEADGPTYELRAILEPFPHEDGRDGGHSSSKRMTPGGFGDLPTGTTLGAVVGDSADEEDLIEPYVGLYFPEVYQRLKERGEGVA